jgi:hypothetical protein
MLSRSSCPGADQNLRRDNVDFDLLEAPKTLRHHVIVDLRTRLLTRSLTSAASIDALTSAINNHAATPEYQKRASMIYAPPLRDSSGTLEWDGGFFLQICSHRYEVGHPDHTKAFADPKAADEWFQKNDPEGAAFEYEVLD